MRGPPALAWSGRAVGDLLACLGEAELRRHCREHPLIDDLVVALAAPSAGARRRDADSVGLLASPPPVAVHPAINPRGSARFPTLARFFCEHLSARRTQLPAAW